MHTWLAAALAAALSIAAVLGYAGHAHAHIIEHLDRQVKHLERFVMSESQDAVNAVVNQLRKIALEVKNEIASVQAQLDAAQVNAEKVDLSALTEAAQALDDIVPDAVPEVEAPADAPADDATNSEV